MLSSKIFHSFYSVIGDFISRPTSTAEQTVAKKQISLRKSKCVSWYPGPDYKNEEHPKSTTNLLWSIDEQALQGQNTILRGRCLPRLPEGEHSAAARSRIRHKAERRRSRSIKRRENIDPTQTLRSNRRRESSVSSTQPPHQPEHTQLKITKQKNRCSTPLPTSISGIETLRKLKQINRRSAPLPIRLPVILVSPLAPLFRDPWVEDAYRELTDINQVKRSEDFAPISPKTRVVKPALLSNFPAKAAATIQATTLSPPRRSHDLSNVPMSASKHSWGMFIDERPPLLLHCLAVLRRPSTGRLVDTPSPTTTTFARQLDSRGWNENMRGTRTFTDGGYWVSV